MFIHPADTEDYRSIYLKPPDKCPVFHLLSALFLLHQLLGNTSVSLAVKCSTLCVTVWCWARSAQWLCHWKRLKRAEFADRKQKRLRLKKEAEISAEPREASLVNQTYNSLCEKFHFVKTVWPHFTGDSLQNLNPSRCGFEFSVKLLEQPKIYRHWHWLYDVSCGPD